MIRNKTYKLAEWVLKTFFKDIGIVWNTHFIIKGQVEFPKQKSLILNNNFEHSKEKQEAFVRL